MPPKLKKPVKSDSSKEASFLSDLKTKCNDGKLFYTDESEDRLKMNRWIIPNDSKFMNFITKEFNVNTISAENARSTMKVWKDEQQKFIDIGPFKHQKFVSDYLSSYSPYRGLLLYHGLGSGKSGASILIGEGFKDRKVCILLPASLRDNYIAELEKFADIGYKKNYHWCKIRLEEGNTDLEEKYISELSKKGVSKELLYKIAKKYDFSGKKIRGIWMIDYNKDQPNYESLDEISKKEISEQIKIMIDHKYAILHYNAGQYTITKILEKLLPNYNVIYSELFGSTPVSKLTNNDRDRLLNYIYENEIENPFNNKVLIVDEIHNLTSGMGGSGHNATRLFELIMRANNIKIVFLSGTPVINNPYELALMFNMLRGFIYSFVIPLEKRDGVFDTNELDKILNNIESVDRFSINLEKNTIEITRLPHKFSNNYVSGKRDGVKYTGDNNGNNKSFTDGVLIELAKKGYQLNGSITQNMYTMFPSMLQNQSTKGSMRGSSKHAELAEKKFIETYVDMLNYRIKNENEFKNRTLGLVSFYNEISGIDKETGANLFPDKIYANIDDTTVEMSNYQFIEYAAKRNIERKLEDRQKTQRARAGEGNDAIGELPSLFKVFSRQKGVFVFPPHIKRPQPPKKDVSLKRKLTSSQVYNLSQEVMEQILQEVRTILTSDVGERYNKFREYLDNIATLDSDKYKFINAVVENLHISNYNDSESYEKWLKTHDFEQDVFDIPEVSEEEEESYAQACKRAIEQLSKDNLTIGGVDTINLSSLSPKYVLMLKNIKSSPGNVFCYSQFRSVEGIEIFRKSLDFNGYSKLETGDTKSADYDVIQDGDMVRYDKSPDNWESYNVKSVSEDRKTVELEGIDGAIDIDRVFKCRYALWTGTESVEERRKTQSTYNSMENMYGQNCLILLTTQSGAEGISLMNVRQVHIMEPYWNNVRIEQVIGRARRIKSHIYLPERHRNVMIYKYIIKFTAKQLDGTWIKDMDKEDISKMKDGEENGFVKGDYVDKDGDEAAELEGFQSYMKSLSMEISKYDNGQTSDQVLHNIAENKELILNKFLKSMKETAIDCEFNKADNIQSDPENKLLNCYIIDSESKYTYELSDSMGDISTSRPEHTRRTTYKLVTISYVLSGKRYRMIIMVKPELQHLTSVNEIINRLSDKQDIYDYYTYNNLYYKDTSKYQIPVRIGTIKKIGQSSTFEFLPTFLEKLEDYSIIEKCIRDKGEYVGDSTDIAKKLLWAQSIRECHSSLSDPLSWTCPICTIELNASINKCTTADCPITKDAVMKLQRKTGRSEGSSRVETEESVAVSKESKVSSSSSGSSIVRLKRRSKK
uniref:Helicase ATP-binding domain-containing protein n=1 Tax=viral metagenome TaxID=1070528 RepID=A0A6C0JDI7_9ZZZZ